jgi:hypothetical protein
MEPDHELKMILRQAEEAFDKSDFDAAVQHFEQAALMGELRTDLVETWNFSHLRFFDRLIALYPDEAVPYMAKAGMLNTLHWQKSAIQVCTEAIERFADHAQLKLRFQMIRLRAAIGAGSLQYLPDYVVEDFVAIWKDLSGGSGKARWHFLRDFLAMRDFRSISVFEALASNANLPHKVRELLKQKAAQLSLLEQLTYDELA